MNCRPLELQVVMKTNIPCHSPWLKKYFLAHCSLNYNFFHYCSKLSCFIFCSIAHCKSKNIETDEPIKKLISDLRLKVGEFVTATKLVFSLYFEMFKTKVILLCIISWQKLSPFCRLPIYYLTTEIKLIIS